MTTGRPTTGSNGASARLAVYGTLGPGGPNHHVLADLGGRWFPGTVRGHLRAEGWGSDLGYPGIELDPDGPEVAVEVLESAALPEHWDRLDAFEGPGYRRVDVAVATRDGSVVAAIYELAGEAGP
ncbi:MAG: gamma-glutamylcyclotransferase [Actinomycetota bacterium]